MNYDETRDTLDAAIEKLRAATAAINEAIFRSPIELGRKAARTALASSPRRFLAYCAFVRLMKSQKEFFSAQTSVLIINTPRNWPTDDFDYVVEISLTTSDRNLTRVKAFCHPPRNRKGNWDFSPRNLLEAQKLVIFLPTGSELHPEFLVAADASVDLEVLTDRHLDSLARQLDVGPLPHEDKALLREQDPTFIDSIFRGGRSAKAALTRLRNLSTKSNGPRRVLPLAAFGAAGVWALDLKRDLKAWREGAVDWSDVDKGVLLFGAPGTGKTSFAATLAHECGAHLVAASLANWQSHGHLGDLLKAMRKDFESAREAAPSILFIDEVDAVGDRRKFSGDNAHYCHEVVNALLEALDGLGGREGVVVVGATNFPKSLDPALVRAGRLERHIELSRPNQIDRAAILEFYFPELVGAKVIREAAQRLVGYTGAELEFLSRRARQSARKSRRAVLANDLYEQLPQFVGLRDKDLWRVCVHEGGHAVAAKALEVGVVERVEVFEAGSADDTSDTGDCGRTWIEEVAISIKTETLFRAEIAMRLAGMAAEAVILGDRSTTSGGSRESDIAAASALVTLPR